MSRKIYLLCLVLYATASLIETASIQYEDAASCNPVTCKLPECRCSGTDIPGGLTREQTPQFVFFTFDDAVTTINIDFYRQAFDNRFNRNGCPVAGTFFISHEYTYYDRVHELYQKGHEIALHSITHEVNLEYWRNMSVETLYKEFADQTKLTARFANISQEQMKGIRLPFLQMSGDNSFKFLQGENFLYDCSWPTQTYISPGLWPYTLNYKSTQDCVIGPCPVSSIPGPWVIPMIMWTDTAGYHCSMVDGCGQQPSEENQIYDWILENFHTAYDTNKAPWGFYMHSAWFSMNPVRINAYIRFIDYLQTLDDVFIVGESEAIKWIKNPIPVSEMRNTDWSNCRRPQPINCHSTNCELRKGEELRYLSVCGSCPAVFPWIGNPYETFSTISSSTVLPQSSLQPYFDFDVQRNITVTVGQTGFLHCRVERLGDKDVSWIRKRDLHILTAGVLTYTSDQRFQVIRSDNTVKWTLQIKYPQPRDSGVYECQINSEPKMSLSYYLEVVEVKAYILGPSDLYVKSGSDINISCKVPKGPHEMGNLFWYKGPDIMDDTIHENEIYLDSLQRITVDSDWADGLTSRLQIRRASPNDTGNYTCVPTLAKAASVFVHIINGEHPAAMQHNNSPSRITLKNVSKLYINILINIIILLLLNYNYIITQSLELS